MYVVKTESGEVLGYFSREQDAQAMMTLSKLEDEPRVMKELEQKLENLVAKPRQKHLRHKKSLKARARRKSIRGWRDNKWSRGLKN